MHSTQDNSSGSYLIFILQSLEKVECIPGHRHYAKYGVNEVLNCVSHYINMSVPETERKQFSQMVKTITISSAIFPVVGYQWFLSSGP